jgi:nicotinamide mononucleotide (NMN) deamidase PncC
VTGAAGPDPLDGAAPGTIVIATFVDAATSVATYTFPGSPAAVCERASVSALHHLGYHLDCAARRGGKRRG